MAMNNKELFQKLDTGLADLNGGKLQGEQAKKFIKKVVNESVLQKTARTMILKEGKVTIPKIGFSGRVLRRGVEHQALSQAQRVKPTIDDMVIETFKFMGEVRLSYEVMKRNVEKGNFVNVITECVKEQVAYDGDDVVLNSNTASAESFYNAFLGARFATSINSIDLTTAVLDKASMKLMLGEMPKKYKKIKSKLVYFCSTESEESYRDQLSNRATALGDMSIQEAKVIKYNGMRLLPVAAMPENLLAGTNKTECLLTNPSNMVIGYDESAVMFEFDKDISAQQVIIVLTLWIGFSYQEEEEVLRGYKISITKNRK
jgi:hypothetical protein